jgi:hypothetical protein
MQSKIDGRINIRGAHMNNNRHPPPHVPHDYFRKPFALLGAQNRPLPKRTQEEQCMHTCSQNKVGKIAP